MPTWRFGFVCRTSHSSGCISSPRVRRRVKVNAVEANTTVDILSTIDGPRNPSVGVAWSCLSFTSSASLGMIIPIPS